MKHQETTLRLEASLIRLRTRQPFFGALALFLEVRLDESIPTACTNGRWVRFNPQFVESINPRELDGVMVHEILHAALRHCTRRGDRDPLRWNVAADISINGMIREVPDLELPFQPIEDRLLKDLEVESIYERLGDSDGKNLPEQWYDLSDNEEGGASPGCPSIEEGQKAYWKVALSRARMLVGKEHYGNLPGSFRRQLDDLLEPKLDWRTLLWRFLARSPIDFEGYDRRFIGSGLYLEDLQGDSLKARVCIDTSGSIDQDTLAQFLSELEAIVVAYPHIDLQLYYADTRLYGPFTLEDEQVFQPQGGGGTDFRPFFNAMDHPDHDDALLVYFTDGHGIMPDKSPGQPLLWVLDDLTMERTPGGFGDVCWIR
jgi:predicted metal-dependent peptidase